jgi:hypothetical protein
LPKNHPLFKSRVTAHPLRDAFRSSHGTPTPNAGSGGTGLLGMTLDKAQGPARTGLPLGHAGDYDGACLIATRAALRPRVTIDLD